MSPHGSTTRPESALRELRLATWQPIEPRPLMLGSLSAVLGDFAAARPTPVVPAQRTTPDVAARLRRG